MATIKKLNCFLCLNLCLSIGQILSTLVNTFVTLSLHFMKAKPDGSHRAPHFLPTIMLTVALLVGYVNFGQIFTAQKLIKERKHNVISELLDALDIEWVCWIGATCVVDLLWYCMVSTMLLKYDFSITYVGIPFLLIKGLRAPLNWGHYKVLAKRLKTDPVPTIPELARETST